MMEVCLTMFFSLSPGSQSDAEFNAKHQTWFEGLSHAVDAMVENNPVLTEALRAVVRKQGKHEELQVCARDISATVAQMAALSRNKTGVLPSAEASLAKVCSEEEALWVDDANSCGLLPFISLTT